MAMGRDKEYLQNWPSKNLKDVVVIPCVKHKTGSKGILSVDQQESLMQLMLANTEKMQKLIIILLNLDEDGIKNSWRAYVQQMIMRHIKRFWKIHMYYLLYIFIIRL